MHRGAGAYICGEETGLIESLEGKRAYPRIKPPYFPAVLGLYQCPTIVNNVETLCHVKHIVGMGGAEYAKIGTAEQHRHAHPLRQRRRGEARLLRSGSRRDHDGRGDQRHLRRPETRAQAQGGDSRRLVRQGAARRRDIQAQGSARSRSKKSRWISIRSRPAGSMAGSGGVIVMDDSRDMVWALNNINEFYAHESCGQCTPCREGSLWMKKITDRMLAGGGADEGSGDC